MPPAGGVRGDSGSGYAQLKPPRTMGAGGELAWREQGQPGRSAQRHWVTEMGSSKALSGNREGVWQQRGLGGNRAQRLVQLWRLFLTSAAP